MLLLFTLVHLFSLLCNSSVGELMRIGPRVLVASPCFDLLFNCLGPQTLDTWTTSASRAGVNKPQSLGQNWPTTCFLKKAVSGHSHIHLIMYCLWLLSCYSGGIE